MAIESLGGVVSGDLATATQASVVNQQEFLRILLTQLSLQDPLKPLDNQEFLAQLAQFTTLEQNRQFSSKLDTLLTIQSATQSIGLIGKTVDVGSGAQAATGQVTTVRFQAGEPILTVSTNGGVVINDVRLSQVSLVR